MFDCYWASTVVRNRTCSWSSAAAAAVAACRERSMQRWWEGPWMSMRGHLGREDVAQLEQKEEARIAYTFCLSLRVPLSLAGPGQAAHPDETSLTLFPPDVTCTRSTNSAAYCTRTCTVSNGPAYFKRRGRCALNKLCLAGRVGKVVWLCGRVAQRIDNTVACGTRRWILTVMRYRTAHR